MAACRTPSSHCRLPVLLDQAGEFQDHPLLAGVDAADLHAIGGQGFFHASRVALAGLLEQRHEPLAQLDLLFDVGVRPGRNSRLRMASSSWWVATKYSKTLGRSQ